MTTEASRAEQILDAFDDQPWDQPPCVVLIATPGHTPDTADGLGNPKRIISFPDGALGGIYPVTGHAKPWLGLARHHAPTWVREVGVVSEAWMNEINAEDHYASAQAFVGGASRQPTRIELRSCWVTNNEGADAGAGRRRDHKPMHSYFGAETPSGNARYSRAYLGLDDTETPGPIRDFLAAIAVSSMVTALLKIDPRRRLADAAHYFDQCFAGISELHADYPDWDAYRARVIEKGPQFGAPWERLASWFGPNDFAAEMSSGVGTVTDHIMRLAVEADIQLGRALDAAYAIQEGDATSNRTIDAMVPKPQGHGVAVSMDPEDDNAWPVTPFGIAFTLPQLPPRVISEERTKAAVARWDRSAVLAEKSGRDLYATRRVAGDVAHVIARLGRSELEGAASMYSQPVNEAERDLTASAFAIRSVHVGAHHRAARAIAATNAVPFFLDAPTVHQIAGAHLPEEDFTDYLRLPFDSVLVVFDQDMGFEDVAGDVIDPLVGVAPIELLGFTGSWAPGFAGGWGSALGELARYGGGLTGIAFHADDDSRLSEWVDWIITTKADPREQRPARTWAVPGHLPHASMRHLALNLAAYVSWGGFTPPKDLPLPDPKSKEWRNATRTSQFRKLEPRGAAVGVHVINPPTPAISASDVGTGRTVTGHLRRAHWRRARIAIRHDDGAPTGPVTGPDAVFGTTYTYRQNFIAPVAVAGGGTGERLAVYRLPIAAEVTEARPDVDDEEVPE